MDHTRCPRTLRKDSRGSGADLIDDWLVVLSHKAHDKFGTCMAAMHESLVAAVISSSPAQRRQLLPLLRLRRLESSILKRCKFLLTPLLGVERLGSHLSLVDYLIIVSVEDSVQS